MFGTLCSLVFAAGAVTFTETANRIAIHSPMSQFGIADQNQCRISLCTGGASLGEREIIDLSSGHCDIQGSTSGHNRVLDLQTTIVEEPSSLVGSLMAAPENSITLYNGPGVQLTFRQQRTSASGVFLVAEENNTGMVVLSGGDTYSIKRAFQRSAALNIQDLSAILVSPSSLVVADSSNAHVFDAASGALLVSIPGSFSNLPSGINGPLSVLCELRDVRSGGIARILLDTYESFPDLMRLDQDCEF